MRESPSIQVRAFALMLAAGLLAASAVGCDADSAEPGPSIEHDEHLSTAILDLADAGEARRLSALTDFAWDAVYVYYEGAPADEIARDVGADLAMNDRYYSAGCLMVFVDDDDVVRAISAPELVTWDGSNRFTAGVRLVPTRPGKSSSLSLEEPA